MHEFAKQAIRRRPADDAHARAMNVDRIIHQAVEPAALDLDKTATVGEVDSIVVARKDLPSGRWDSVEMPQGDVLGILGQQPQARTVKQVQVLDGCVLAIDDEEPGMVAFAVAKDEDIPWCRPPAKTAVEPDEALLQFLGSVCPPILSQAAFVAGARNDPQRLAVEFHRIPPDALPTLSNEDELSVFDDKGKLPVVDPKVEVVLGREKQKSSRRHQWSKQQSSQ